MKASYSGCMNTNSQFVQHLKEFEIEFIMEENLNAREIKNHNWKMGF